MKDKIDTAAFFLWFKVLQAIDSSLYLALQQLQKKIMTRGELFKTQPTKSHLTTHKNKLVYIHRIFAIK